MYLPSKAAHTLVLALTLGLGLEISTGAANAQQFSPATILPGDALVGAPAANQHHGHVALGDGHALVVYEDDASSLVDSVFGQQAFGSPAPGNHDIHGMLLDSNGNPQLAAPIVIAAGTWDQLEPQVAWNGTEYLVVYRSTATTPNFYSTGIEAVRVTATGQVLDTEPIVIHDSPDFDESMPTVASLGGDWLVAWSGFDFNSSTPLVEGRVVTSTGMLGPLKRLIDDPNLYPTSFELAASNNRYCLAFSISFGQGMRAQLFNSSGDATTNVATVQNGFGNHPSVAGAANGFYMVWISGGLRGAAINLTGGVSPPGGDLLVNPPLSNTTEAAVAWDGTRYLAVYAVGSQIHYVTRDSAGQPLAGPQVLTTSSESMRDPAVAAGSGKAHVLWTDKRLSQPQFTVDPDDVWGLTLAFNGAQSNPQPFSLAPPSQVGARLAGDLETGFLVCFMSYTAAGVRVLAQAVDANGVATAAEPFVITQSNQRDLYRPDIAFNGSEFLVVWHRLQSALPAGPPPLVESRRCLRDGTLLDPGPVVLMEGFWPAVESLGPNFLVAASFEHPLLQPNGRVFARRIVGASGAWLEANPIDIGPGGGPLDVSAIDDRWFVAYHGVRIAWVDPTGATAGPIYSADTNSSSGHTLRLARNVAQDRLLLTYESRDSSNVYTTTDIRMRRFDRNLSSTDPFLGPLVTSATNAQLRPVCAWVGDEALFAWADHRGQALIEPGLGDVFASRTDRLGTLLDPNGLPVAITASPEGAPELLGLPGGQALYGYSAVAPTGPLAGVHRLHLGRYQSPTLGTFGCAQPVPNSSGLTGVLSVHGSSDTQGEDLLLRAQDLPAGQFGMFLVGTQSGILANPGGSQGNLCVVGAIGRYNAPLQIQQVSPAGRMELFVNPAATPTPFGPAAILAGETRYFQAWHRDFVGGASTSNFTSSIGLMFH